MNYVSKCAMILFVAPLLMLTRHGYSMLPTIDNEETAHEAITSNKKSGLDFFETLILKNLGDVENLIEGFSSRSAQYQKCSPKIKMGVKDLLMKLVQNLDPVDKSSAEKPTLMFLVNIAQAGDNDLFSFLSTTAKTILLDEQHSDIARKLGYNLFGELFEKKHGMPDALEAIASITRVDQAWMWSGMTVRNALEFLNEIAQHDAEKTQGTIQDLLEDPKLKDSVREELLPISLNIDKKYKDSCSVTLRKRVAKSMLADKDVKKKASGNLHIG